MADKIETGCHWSGNIIVPAYKYGESGQTIGEEFLNISADTYSNLIKFNPFYVDENTAAITKKKLPLTLPKANPTLPWQTTTNIATGFKRSVDGEAVYGFDYAAPGYSPLFQNGILIVPNGTGEADIQSLQDGDAITKPNSKDVKINKLPFVKSNVIRQVLHEDWNSSRQENYNKNNDGRKWAHANTHIVPEDRETHILGITFSDIAKYSKVTKCLTLILRTDDYLYFVNNVGTSTQEWAFYYNPEQQINQFMGYDALLNLINKNDSRIRVKKYGKECFYDNQIPRRLIVALQGAGGGGGKCSGAVDGNGGGSGAFCLALIYLDNKNVYGIHAGIGGAGDPRDSGGGTTFGQDGGESVLFCTYYTKAGDNKSFWLQPLIKASGGMGGSQCAGSSYQGYSNAPVNYYITTDNKGTYKQQSLENEQTSWITLQDQDKADRAIILYAEPGRLGDHDTGGPDHSEWTAGPFPNSNGSAGKLYKTIKLDSSSNADNNCLNLNYVEKNVHDRDKCSGNGAQSFFSSGGCGGGAKIDGTYYDTNSRHGWQANGFGGGGGGGRFVFMHYQNGAYGTDGFVAFFY